MPWTSARVAGSVLAAAAATLATAAPAIADAPTPRPKHPGVGASAMVTCGLSYPDKDHHGWINFPASTVTLRSGPSNACMQTGQGMYDQRADYLCYLPGDGGTWTFVRNTSTGAQGWVRDDQLPAYGSDVVCDNNPPPSTVRG